VTEQHLREARSNVEDLIEVGQKRERRRGLALVAAAAVVVPIVGIVAFQAMDDGDTSGAPSGKPSSVDPYASFLEGSDPTVDALTGVWRQDNGFMLLRFEADGTVQFNDQGGLFAAPSTTATYEISGENITVTTTGGGADGRACTGTRMAFRASVPEPGIVHLVNSGPSDACTILNTGAQWSLEQVLPNSAAVSGVGPADDVPFEPVTRPGILHGDWVNDGGGFLLELSQGGTYIVAAGAGDIVDSGRWTLTDQVLTLTSGSGSSSCSNGDRLVMQGLSYNVGPTSFIRGEISGNDCGGAWSKTDWFLLPRDDGN
jgi:hypothetical protein